MTTNKKLLICTLLILTMFSIVGAASASDLTNANSTTSDTHSETISHDYSQSSATESHATQLKSSSDNKEKQTATNDEITSSSQIDEEITTEISEEKTTSSDIKEQSTKDKKLYKSSQKEDKLTASGDTYVVDANGGGDYTTISEAVSAASGGETIFIKNGEYTETNTITFTKSVSVVGESQYGVKITGAAKTLFGATTDNAITLSFTNLTILNAGSGSNPALKLTYCAHDLILTNCTFDNCGSKYGTMQLGHPGTAIIDNCKILNSKETGTSGSGAIYVTGAGQFTIKNSIINNVQYTPTTSYMYSVIYVSNTNAVLNIENTTISNCTGPTRGIINTVGTVNIKGSKIKDNSLSQFSETMTNHLIYIGDKGQVTIEQTEISNNTCVDKIFNNYKATSKLTVNYCNINDNTASGTVNSEGTIDLETNYWGSDNKPDDVTANTIIVETSEGYKIKNIETSELSDLDKIIPGLNEEPPRIIYVSTTGENGNDGLTKDTAVKTINEAINKGITSFEDNFTIYISSGTYEITETINLNKNLTIIGEDQTILTRNANVNIFKHESDDSKDIILENLIFTSPTEYSEKLIDFKGEAVLRIIKCKFTDAVASTKGIIHIHGNITATMDSCEFYNLKTDNANRPYVYIDGHSNVTIKNSRFHDLEEMNLKGTIQIDEDTAVADVSNCKFYNIKITNNCNGIIFATAAKNLTINNCSFENNNIKGYGIITKTGGSSVNVNININKTSFTNNTVNSENSIIFIQKYANANVEYCTFNDLKTDQYAIKTGATTATVTANYNWYGTNSNPTDLISSNVNVINWVIMNVTPTNPNDLFDGETQEITVDFKHYNNNAGNVGDLTIDTLPEITVSATTTPGLGQIEDEITTNHNTATFTYTAINKGTETINIIAGKENQEITINVNEHYTGPIYVSQETNANNDNDGSEDSPVRTIAKALELTQYGSTRIIIKEGTYKGTLYIINKSLNITGEGKVIIDGENEGGLFIIGKNDNTINVTFNNLVFSGAKRTKYDDYGGIQLSVIYNYANLTLNKVNITNNPESGNVVDTYNDLTIKNSVISEKNIYSAIVSGTGFQGNIIINNTLFENNKATKSSSIFGLIDTSSGNGNLIIENTRFINNTANYGTIYSKINTTVKNSTFKNNTGITGSGAAISLGSPLNKLVKLNVVNSTFINNRAKADGGAIYIASKDNNVTINKSTFINNTANTGNSGNNGDAISNNGNLTINYSVLLTNNTNNLIDSDEDVDAKYNWWGTNDNPSSLVSDNVDASNWVLMTVTPDSVTLDPSADEEITVDFTQYNGGSEPLAKNIPELDVTASVTNGELNTTKATTKNNVAKFKYTAPSTGEEDTVTFNSGSQELNTIITINNEIPEPITIYVKSNGNDANDGLTNDTAVKTIKHAIDLIQISGKIIINEGTYEEKGLTITKNINITGKGKVTIDAKNQGQIFNIQNSKVTIDNLTLINGNADNGGAIQVINSDITITNTTFKTNNAEHFGGAIYVDSNSEAKINKSVFINNFAKGYYDYGMYYGGGDAVYNNGKTTINYSLLIAKKDSMSRALISNNNVENPVNAEFNWWGNLDAANQIYDMDENDDDTVINIDNEVIMTLTPTDNIIYSDGTTTIKVEFKLENGNTLTESLPTLKINATTDIGNLGTTPKEVTLTNNEATFTYTPTETGTATIKVSYEHLNPITTTTIEVREAGTSYSGPIYVSKSTDASDDNEGSETKPVASITKAIELAQSGSGKIIIKEGTYEQNGFEITKDLNITGDGKVVIKGNNNGLFTIGSDVNNLQLKNLVLTGTNNAISSSAKKLVLDNITITKSSGNIITNSGNLTIIKSTISDNNCEKLIISTSGNITLEDSQFINNTAKNSVLSGNNIESINVKNSKFVNNTNTIGFGGAIYAGGKTKLDIISSEFINNKAGQNGGAIYADGVSTITQSTFINNSADYGNVIYNTGQLTINYSVLLTNTTGWLIVNADDEYAHVTATYNWWGNNTPTFSKLVTSDSWTDYEGEEQACDAVDTSTWVIMNVTPTNAELYAGASQEITVDFTKDNTGTQLGKLIPELDVTASVINGTLDITKATTKNNIAKFKYTTPTNGEEKGNITFKSGNQTLTTTIKINNEIPEPTTGIVYVSKATNANDYNEGTKEKPVATIAKAIEIATSSTGSKKIIILEGTYIANGIMINSDLNITGQGNVIWDANGTQAFNMTTKNILIISNITFTNGNSSSYGHLFRVDNGEISIDNCKFLSNGGTVGGTNGIIYIKNAKLTVTNSTFENNTAGAGTSYGIISVNDGELYVDNCNFTNNYNKNGMIYIKATNIGSYAIIKNSKFIGNNATSSSGGSGAGIYLVGDYINNVSTTVLVDNCEFINNTAKGGKYYAGDGGAIHVANNATLIVSKSKFINNYVENNTNNTIIGKGGAIYAHAGNVKITESLFENNFATQGSEIYMEYLSSITDDNLHRLNVTQSTFNSTSTSKLIESNYNNGKLFAIGNTWINTEDPSTRVSEGIIVKEGKLDPTITINVNNPTEGEKATITVNTGDATGNVTITIEGKEPKTIDIINGIATLNTTELTAGTYNITVTYNGDNKYNTKTENTTITIKSKTTPPGPTPTNVVSPETISNFFDENGVLKEDAPEELVFSGEFKDLTLTINKPVSITGDNAVFNNSALNITADNVKVSNITFVADENFDKTALISTNGKNTTIENNTMTITGNPKATGIFAENATIAVNNNNITTTNNNTMILNNTNGTLNNNKLKAGNNINGSASISHSGSNVTVDNKPLTEPETEPGKKDSEKQTPQTPKQDTTTQQTTQTTQTQATQQRTQESEKNIPAKQIKITTPKTPKTISKRAKKLTIKVKLKVKGKLAKGKKVVIIIKGKKYTRKTNKKGIAKLTLKKAKLQKILRKVKVGKKITYKVKYGKKTIKRSLKVKK